MAVPIFPFFAFDNRFADAVPVASSTAVGGAAINLTDFRPYTSWTPTALPATVTVDCGTAKSADKLSVFNHNLFTKGNTIEVRGSTDNFVASNVLVHSYAPPSDNAFVRDFAAQSFRYWRINILNGTAPTLTIVALGTGFEFPTNVPYGISPLDRDVVAQTNISERGLPLGRVILFERWAEKLTFNHVDQTWLRATFLPAWKAHLRGKPFLFGFDLTNFPNEIYLVQTDGKMDAPFPLPSKANLSINISGVALA